MRVETSVHSITHSDHRQTFEKLPCVNRSQFHVQREPALLAACGWHQKFDKLFQHVLGDADTVAPTSTVAVSAILSGNDEEDDMLEQTGSDDEVDITAVSESTAAEGAADAADASTALVEYDRWANRKYTTKDHRELEKKDFVTVKVPIAELRTDMRNYFYQFVQHHELALWCY